MLQTSTIIPNLLNREGLLAINPYFVKSLVPILHEQEIDQLLTIEPKLSFYISYPGQYEEQIWTQGLDLETKAQNLKSAFRMTRKLNALLAVNSDDLKDLEAWS